MRAALTVLSSFSEVSVSHLDLVNTSRPKSTSSVYSTLVRHLVNIPKDSSMTRAQISLLHASIAPSFNVGVSRSREGRISLGHIK